MRSRAGAARELLRRPRELWLFARICMFQALVPWMTRLPLPRLARLVTRPPRSGVPAAEKLERMARLVALAPQLAEPIVRTGCLPRGVTLFWFLRQAGFDVELRFGIDPTQIEPADAHCWITLDDQPILERRDPRPRFVETWRLPLAPA